MVPLGGSVCGSGVSWFRPGAVMRIRSVPQAERMNRTRPVPFSTLRLPSGRLVTLPSSTTRPPPGCLVTVRGCPGISWPLTSRRLLLLKIFVRTQWTPWVVKAGVADKLSLAVP